MSQSVESVTSRVQHPRWGAVCMLLSIAFFSINSLTLKYVSLSEISPWVALLFRATVGMIFVATVFRGGAKVDFRRALTSRLLATRGMLGVCGTVAYYFTIDKLGPGKATLISNTYVVIAALMAVWILKESFSTSKLVGNILALVGLTLLIASPTQLMLFGWYEALAVFGSLMAAGTVIIIRELTRTESTAMIYTSQCIYVLVGSIPFALYELQRGPMDTTNALLLVLAGISATIGQLAMTEGFRHLTVAVGGAFQICVPVVIAIGGVLLFNEIFSTMQIVGAVLILLGCYWVMVIR
ncbi:MAG: DMT family transporter [Pirellulaceae bacterium]|nr:DMT family transporter [Pirellulaceae bacterium]